MSLHLIRVVGNFQVTATPGYNGCFADFEIAELHNGGSSLGGTWEVLVTGSLRFDGCVNSHMADGNVFHFCGPDGVDKLAAAWKVVWEMGPELMPGKWLP